MKASVSSTLPPFAVNMGERYGRLLWVEIKLSDWLFNGIRSREASTLWRLPDGQTLTGKRNRAIFAILLGCGLRRRELAELTLSTSR